MKKKIFDSLSSFFLVLLFSFNTFSQKNNIILDADTGNEIDDLYAIAYLLGVSGDELKAISAAHFNNVDLVTDTMWNAYSARDINTMKLSHNLNKEIVEYSHRNDVACLMGAQKIIGRSWGGSEARPSEASAAIIKAAMNVKDGKKLHILALGAVTNIASAIIENPGVEDKIALYMMGAKYYPDRNVWDKSEFNIRNDLNAFDYLLNSSVEMHIMPANIANKLRFDKHKTLDNLNTNSKLDLLLSQRWTSVTDLNSWVMWDLALILAYFNPDFATKCLFPAPPENKKRDVFVYTGINHEKMEKHFWEVFQIKFQ